MPACAKCEKFDAVSKQCLVTDGTPVRKCVIASLDARIRQIKSSTVVEVGCGGWTYSKELIEANGNTWFGIDPSPEGYGGAPSIRTHDGTVANLPFDSNSIDYIVANQSMEHWFQFGTSFRKGLLEIHRVLKPAGKAILNVPIHLHGHPIFIKGDLTAVKKVFSKNLWELVELEEWRRDFRPLEPYAGWNKKKVHDRERAWLPNPMPVNTWMLEIVATKKADTEGWKLRQDLGVVWIDWFYGVRLKMQRLSERLKRLPSSIRRRLAKLR